MACEIAILTTGTIAILLAVAFAFPILAPMLRPQGLLARG